MNIDAIRANVVGDYGLSSSNKYQISFELKNNLLTEYLFNRGISGISSTNPIDFESGEDTITNATILSFLADEINLPGFSVATGEFKGHVPGINIRYAHTRNFNEANVSFLMDMSHLPLKFLRFWSDFMFGFEQTENITYSLMNYYDDYTCDIIIDKLEPNVSPKKRKSAKSSRDTHTVVTRTKLYNAFPYLVNDATLGNGPNQPYRVQSTFYYEYMRTVDPGDQNRPSFDDQLPRDQIGLNFLGRNGELLLNNSNLA